MGKKQKEIRTRDYAMKRLIEGATKAGVHVDQKKEEDKYAARGREDIERCRQCSFPLFDTEDERPDDFCSFSCQEFYNEQRGLE